MLFVFRFSSSPRSESISIGLFLDPSWCVDIRCCWWYALNSAVRLVSDQLTESESLMVAVPTSTHTTVLMVIILVREHALRAWNITHILAGLCVHRLCHEPQDWKSIRHASSPNCSSSGSSRAWQCTRLLPDNEIQERPDLWRYQHHWKLRNCLPGSSLLAACNRESARDNSQGLPSWRTCMVCQAFMSIVIC